MKRKHFLLRIDAAFSKDDPPLSPKAPAVVLMPDPGEYVRALARLAALGPEGPAGRSVPDEVYLHLFANELAERMEEFLREPDSPEPAWLVAPFWPEALFDAAGLPVHGALEIQAGYPPPAEVRYVPRAVDRVKAEARRVLGDVRFDPLEYDRIMTARAKARGWKVEEA
jgi:hypothetical protein